MGKGKLDRAEALQVLKEILKKSKDQTRINFISLNKIRLSSHYVKKFRASLDYQLERDIESILGKHELAMKKTNGSDGFIVIYSSKEIIPKEKCLI